jgi:hypothetical protein
MARTQIRGTSQILNSTINYGKIESTSLVDSTYDGGLGISSVTVSADNTVPSTYAVKQYVDNLSAGLIYKGIFDANAPNDYSLLVPASQGDFYKISVAGTIGSTLWAVGDMLIINKNCAGIPTAADVDQVDNTESADILRETNVKDVSNKTINGDLNTLSNISISSLKPVSGDAGKYLKRDALGNVISSAISASEIVNFSAAVSAVIATYPLSASNIVDFTEAAQDAVGNILTNTGNVQFNYNDAGNIITASVSAALVPVIANFVAEPLVDSGDRTVYTCSQVPVLVIAVTLDGLEQEEGAAYDYTINKATRTITFTSANNASDRVRIKYFVG